MINNYEPNWADLPDGSQLDVAPLINNLDVFDSTPQLNKTDGMRNLIRRTIRILNVADHSHDFTRPVDLINLYADLHRLEDIFDSMKEKLATE